MMSQQSLPHATSRPPFAVAMVVCAGLVAIMAYVRLAFMSDHLGPVGFALPLLITFWHRDRRLLYGMAVAFTVLDGIEVFHVLPEDRISRTERWLAAGVTLFNIWLATGVLHLLLASGDRLERKRLQLEQTNDELTAANEELTAREAEITNQNEELRCQAEELEQQTEELRQQGEEIAQQREQEQVLNEEMARREGALQTLLESARLLSQGLSEELLSGICEALLKAMEDSADAAVVLESRGDRLEVRGHAGFGEGGPQKRSWTIDRSLAQVAILQERTASLPDLRLRPDLEVPRTSDGRELRSAIMAPLRVRGRVVGVLEACGREPRQWTRQDFRIIEWLAAESSVVLEAAELQQELEQRRREAEDNSVRKTRFLAAVSHDVRTPANAISLLAELIAESASDPELAKDVPQMASDLRASARSLVALVTEVLDLARMDASRPELQESVFELWPAIDAELRHLQPLAASKGLSLKGTPCEGIWLKTDRIKLSRVLANLIGNAVKFTEHGEVRLETGWRADGSLALQIIDTGVGISPKHLPYVFDEFYQLRNPERDRSKGTGLGLAICKRLVDAMGCTITAESTPGRGCNFTVEIPTALVTETPTSSVSTVSENGPAKLIDSGLDGLHILLVEDHDTTREITARLLQARGARVTEAENAGTAIDKLTNRDFHVLLLDLMLPDMDGREVLKYLQQHSPAALRCILAVSGDVTTTRAEEVLRLGAHGLIPKPVDIDHLAATIRKVFDRRE